MATMLLPAVLASRAGGARKLVVRGVTLSEVLDEVALRHAELARTILGKDGISPYMNVYVNELDVRASGGLATPVAEGDEISVIPAVAGG
jgi:molybdopterin converting factor small subunit